MKFYWTEYKAYLGNADIHLPSLDGQPLFFISLFYFIFPHISNTIDSEFFYRHTDIFIFFIQTKLLLGNLCTESLEIRIYN